MTTLRLGDIAPDFLADTTTGPIRFHEWKKNSWAILFSHPKDFTPVCTTELGYMAKIMPEFDKRHVKVIGLSVDNLDDHEQWILDINKTQGTEVNFPLISDPTMTIAKLYDMIHPNEIDAFTIRSVYILDPQNKVRLILSYPASTGRDFDEILRVVDSLQLTDQHFVATPVNWRPGEACVVLPNIDSAELPKKFPQGYEELTPYLRLTPYPKTEEETADS